MFNQSNSTSYTDATSHSDVSSKEACSKPTVSVMDDFVAALQKDMQVLELKVNREDSLTVASVAYRVKSKAKALGIHAIHRSADQIETCARRNQLAQLSAEIDLMRHQVELFIQSTDKALTKAGTC